MRSNIVKIHQTIMTTRKTILSSRHWHKIPKTAKIAGINWANLLLKKRTVSMRKTLSAMTTIDVGM